MKKVTDFFYYVLSVALTFGSVNPFTVHVDDAVIGEQQGYTPVLLAICVILSLCNKSIRKHIRENESFIRVLLGFDLILLISGVFYDTSTINDVLIFLIKLIACEVGFIVFLSYFKRYPSTLNWSLILYQISCTIIVILFFVGALSSVLYYSNGRLFLFGINPNTFSFMMGLGVLYALNDLLYKNRLKIVKAFDVFSILILFMYIILSGSRGSFLFCGLGCVLLIWKQLWKKFYLIIPILIASYFVLSIFVKDSSENIALFDRLEDLKQGDERDELIGYAFQIFADGPVVIGVGNNGYIQESKERFQEVRDSHNLIVSTLVLTGILGTILLLRFFFLLYNRIRKTHYQNKLAFALFVYMLLISLKTGWVLTYTLMWYVFSVSMALTTFKKNETISYKINK